MHVQQPSVRRSGQLAHRLRELREKRWPDHPVTQSALAKALGGRTPLAGSTISAWENPTSPNAPPDFRLRAVATFFATERSVAEGTSRVLTDAELTDDERQRRDVLYEELLSLRSSDSPTAHAATWQFPDGGPVRLVCGKLDDQTHPYARESSPNYTALLNYADLDALVELQGHVRRENPTADVRYRLAEDMRMDHLSSHLVLLGGVGLNPATRWLLLRAALPVRQVADETIEDGEVFEVGEGADRRRFYPTVEDDPMLGLVEDLGLLVRMRNPNNQARTLTICSGTYSRGVLGAVRCLTDAQLRDRNEAYLAERFGGRGEFAILMRVPVFRGDPATPDLSDPDVRLFEWPERTA